MIFITHTLPRKGKTVTAAQVAAIMGGASDQSWRLVEQQRAAALDLKLLMEIASYPQSFVEEKQLPLTSEEWVSECCPQGLGRLIRHQILSTTESKSSIQNTSDSMMTPSQTHQLKSSCELWGFVSKHIIRPGFRFHNKVLPSLVTASQTDICECISMEKEGAA